MSTAPPHPRDGGHETDARLKPANELFALEQLALFEAVFGQSPIGAAIFDTECRYVTVNKALQEIVGLPLQQLIGQRIEDVLGPVGQGIAANLVHAMSTGEPVVNRDFTGSTYAHAGVTRWFLASYFALTDASGRMIGAASLVNDVTEQRRTRDELAAANERLALLGRVSDLLASSLDLEATLSTFADLVVPAFADHCVVDLLDSEPGVVRRVALVHAAGLAPDNDAWALPGHVVDYPADHPAAVAMQTGRGVVELSGAEPDFQHIAPTPESAAYGRHVGVRSAMTVPLVARGVVLGAVSFVTSASGRVFGEADLEIGEDLASRAAIALDNARLFGREQRIALTLQRSLLPARLPATPGLQTAAVYRPAAQDGAVGGDWYDVIPLPCGRIGLVMGDVMGRGVPAAALMGQVRAAVRAYAAQDLPPAELLSHLDDLVRGLDVDTLVTCVYAVYDPVEDALCVSNAGHVPPLLVVDGSAERIEAHGVLLGAGQGSYEQTEVPFGRGAMLALYTDGLVERRTEDIDARIELLASTLTAGSDDVDQLCADAVDLIGGDGGEDDDVAVMIVRPHPTVRPVVARLDIVPHVGRVRELRRFASEVLAGWGEPPEVAEQVRLVVSELVTNVIRHADGHEATLRLERHLDRIVVAVVDPDPAPPREVRATADSEGGRGLTLVSALTHRWGSRPIPGGGKVVWCELLPVGLGTGVGAGA